MWKLLFVLIKHYSLVLYMGNAYSIPKIHFEELQTQIMKGGDYLLINTLPLDMQQCLICSTVVAQDEETIMNTMIK